MKSKVLFFTIILISTASYFFLNKKNEIKSNIPVIVCTTSIIADVVKNIIGNHAEVISIMGPGIDPHLYKASSGDIYRINQASLIFYNGLHLEGKMGEIFESMHKRGKKIYAVSKAIPKSLLLSTEYEGIYDPHIWHDVILWKYVVQGIINTLLIEFPLYKDNISKNGNQYLLELDALHSSILEKISCIKYSKILITSHDAFSYFAKRYGIECYSVQGISTDSEPSIQDNEKILQIILNNQIKTIFVEQTVAENYLKNLQSILSLNNVIVNLAKDKLYSDALGEEEGTTYIDMMTDNVNAIVQGMNNYEK